MNLTDKRAELIIDNGVLRTLVPEDIHQGYVEGLNDPEVNRYLVGVAQSRQTFKSVEVFVKHSLKASNEVLFGIWNEHDKKHCGTIRLHGIDPYHQTAHIGVCLFDKQAWGKGLATKSIRAVTAWGLNRLGLRWIEAGVYEENRASSKLFERSGYELKYRVSGKYLFRNLPSTVLVYASCLKRKSG